VVNRPSRPGIGVIFCVSLLSLLSGCSGNSSPSNNKGSGSGGFQFVSPTAAPSLDAGQSITITVNEPVTWSLQGVIKNTGSLTNPTSTSVVYNAPSVSNVLRVLTATVVATLTSDTTQSFALGVTINPFPTTQGALSANTSCQYDPIAGIGQSSGTVGTAYPGVGSNPPRVVNGTAPFTWSIVTGSLPVGVSLASQTTSGTASEAYLYGTPASAGCSQITLQVKDATGATATTTTNFLIVTPPNLKMQVPNYTDTFSSVPYPPTAFSVSGGVPPYRNWSVEAANPLPIGMSLTPDSQNTAAAMVLGAPQACSLVNCQTFNPIIEVEDSQVPYPAFGTAELNILEYPALPASACEGANGTLPSNLASIQGSYAFLLRGFDAQGPVVMAGSFAADGNGNVTGGVEDVMRTSGSQTEVAISGGSYSVIQQSTTVTAYDEAGCLTLTTSSGSTSFAISMGGCSTSPDPVNGSCANNSQGVAGLYTTGRLIEFDDNTGTGTRGSGILRLQTSSAFSAGLSGFYAFGVSGGHNVGAQYQRYAMAGSFNTSSSSLSGVAADINDGGSFQASLTGGSGSITSDATTATTGRVAATLSVGSSSFPNLVAYVVSPQEAIVVNGGTPSATNPVFGGEAIHAAGPFSNASIQNTHIFRTGGLSPSGPDANLGLLQFDGGGSFTGSQFEDQAGTVGGTSLSGSYTVDGTTGRMVLLAPTEFQNVGDHPLVAYIIPVSSNLTRQDCVQLASCVTGFLVSTDATAQGGEMEFQTPTIAPPPPFSTLFLSGYFFYSTDEMLDPSSPVFSGTSNADPTGTKYGGIQSASYPNSTYCLQPSCSLLLPNETISVGGSGISGATYSVNGNGTGTIGGETIAVTNGNITFYIDESPTNSHPAVMVLEQ
jgi:hypothetical protein